MNYNGIELKEFTSDRPVVFDPPRKMLVWNIVDREPCERTIVAYLPGRSMQYAVGMSDAYSYCAEIPEEPKPRRATNRELAKWLAQGNGEKTLTENDTDNTAHYEYESEEADEEVPDIFVVRKWDDEEWHEPTADYMGLEG